MIFGLFRMWLIGLLTVGLWVGAGFLFRAWNHRLPDPRPAPEVVMVDGKTTDNVDRPATFGERVSAWRPAMDWTTAYLAGAATLTLLSLGGGRGLFWLLLPHRKDDPKHERAGEVRRIHRPDGAELHVEIAGNPAGPTIVLTHGWGASATEWDCLRRQIGDRFRLVAWDLPGLGLSKSPTDKYFGLDRLAGHLKAVLDETCQGPVVLLGHSIGGMTTLNFAKLFPAELGGRVAGLVLVHTTHTNPLKTMKGSALYVPLQKPVLEPMAYLMIGLSPLVWLMNAASYLGGSLHWSNYKSVFSYHATWGELEFVSRYALQIWPATYARGILGMFGYHATDILGRIDVPTLVVAADRDKICKPEASHEIRAAVPRSELAILSPAGHMGLLSSHEEFGRTVAAFAGKVLGEAGGAKGHVGGSPLVQAREPVLAH